MAGRVFELLLRAAGIDVELLSERDVVVVLVLKVGVLMDRRWMRRDCIRDRGKMADIGCLAR